MAVQLCIQTSYSASISPVGATGHNRMGGGSLTQTATDTLVPTATAGQYMYCFLCGNRFYVPLSQASAMSVSIDKLACGCVHTLCGVWVA